MAKLIALLDANVLYSASLRDIMNKVIPESLVEDYESLIPSLSLSDPDDRYVLAAAIKAEAKIMVTINLKDFPKGSLQPFEIEALHPDTFICRLLELDFSGVLATMKVSSSPKPLPC